MADVADEMTDLLPDEVVPAEETLPDEAEPDAEAGQLPADDGAVKVKATARRVKVTVTAETPAPDPAEALLMAPAEPDQLKPTFPGPYSSHY